MVAGIGVSVPILHSVNIHLKPQAAVKELELIADELLTDGDNTSVLFTSTRSSTAYSISVFFLCSTLLLVIMRSDAIYSPAHSLTRAVWLTSH